MGNVIYSYNGKNDLKLYEELFTEYFEQLCSYVYSYIPDADVAKDIVQDVFLYLWQERHKIELTKYLLYTSAKNRALNYLKAHNNTKVVKDIPLETIINIGATYPEEEFDFQLLLKEFISCLNSLPPKCREIFMLSRNENLKNKEIASRLNISLKAVEKQITKALVTLRTHLKEKDLLEISLAIYILLN